MKSILDHGISERKTVDFEELVNYIFFKNASKKKILIETSDLRTSKDIFCFCLDLFCKGLILCNGDENKRVEVESLQIEDIQNVIDKLSYTGIMTIVQISTLKEMDNAGTPHDLLVKSVNDINSFPDNGTLSEYDFKLRVNEVVYIIRFELKI